MVFFQHLLVSSSVFFRFPCLVRLQMPVHYNLRHYSAWIREHGPLPYSSTEQSESYHKSIKSAYRQSNKGPDAERFCVRDEARRFVWAVWKQTLPHA